MQKSKTINIYIAFLFLFFTGFIQQTNAAKPLVLTQKSRIPAGMYLDILPEMHGTLSLADILKPEIQKQFFQNPVEVPNYTNRENYLWCKLTLTNKTDWKWAFETASILDSVEIFYNIVNGTTFSKKGISSLTPLAEREVAYKHFILPLELTKDSTQTIYIRVKSHFLQLPVFITTYDSLIAAEFPFDLSEGMWMGFMLLMLVYSILLYIIVRDKLYFYYIFYILGRCLFIGYIKGLLPILFTGFAAINFYGPTYTAVGIISSILFSVHFLKSKKYTPKIYWLLMLTLLADCYAIVANLMDDRQMGSMTNQTVSMFAIILFFWAGIATYRKGFKPARYYLIAWSGYLIGNIIYLLMLRNVIPFNYFTESSGQFGSIFQMVMFSFAIADMVRNERIEKEQTRKELIVTLLDKERIVRENNKDLEKKVKERTEALQVSNTDLSKAMDNLQTTQQQLIQQEKMASLGQLTAGVAHEIQNPLNFINNFSKLSIDLFKDIKDTTDETERLEILNDLEQNLGKINAHGMRVDAIVKGMLQHSRTDKGEKKPTEINRLIKEVIDLAHQNAIINDPQFECEVVKNLDPSIHQINIIPQDITRVLLNLLSNSFYALKNTPNASIVITTQYLPATVSAEALVKFSIKDNGPGIPYDIQQKIFEPFFTTKPTGDGTGLGLSICYDIIKSHGGTIEIVSEVGKGAEFIITLPT